MGIIGGVLFLCLKNVALFALGFMSGLILALMAAGAINNYVSASTAEETWFIVIMWIGAVILGVVCGIIAVCVERILFISFTAVFGSYLAVAAVDYLVGDGQFSSILINAVEGVQNTFDSAVVGVMFISWIGLAVAGMIVQFCITSSGYNRQPQVTSYCNGSSSSYKQIN